MRQSKPGAVSGFLPGGGRDIFRGWRKSSRGKKKNCANLYCSGTMHIAQIRWKFILRNFTDSVLTTRIVEENLQPISGALHCVLMRKEVCISESNAIFLYLFLNKSREMVLYLRNTVHLN